ncbi:MAG: hypothetical protein EP298_09930 [Gammaproteobacteria bacterium]|nr:MAG: hypothetical protein EP298_09930 [Gammaproteobacteria bacterium]UTW41537.1 hypothetical protein KFE69_08445 [bacterium SCSIO 12844]
MKLYITANKPKSVTHAVLMKVLSSYTNQIEEFYPAPQAKSDMDKYFDPQFEDSYNLQPDQLYIGDGNLDNGEYISENLLAAINQNPQTNFILYSATETRCDNFREQVEGLSNVVIVNVPIRRTSIEEAMSQFSYEKLQQNQVHVPRQVFSEFNDEKEPKNGCKCIVM